MADMKKSVKLKSSQNNAVEYKQQDNIALQLLVKSQTLEGQTLNLCQLMTYPLTTVPFSLAEANGFMVKTDKSKALNYLTKDIDDTPVLLSKNVKHVHISY